MTILFGPMMYFFGGLILFTSLVAILAIILSLRFNSKRISEIEKQAEEKYISRKDILGVTNRIEKHIGKIEVKIERLIELK